MMNMSRIFGVVAWQLMFDDLGDFELSVQYVSSWGESTYYIVRASRLLGTRRYWRI
jgi:hypothetical protein